MQNQINTQVKVTLTLSINKWDGNNVLMEGHMSFLIISTGKFKTGNKETLEPEIFFDTCRIPSGFLFN